MGRCPHHDRVVHRLSTDNARPTGRRRVLVVDNYDSFTHNAVDLLTQLGAEVTVRRNDDPWLGRFDPSTVRGIVLSPGPGRPRDAGACLKLVRRHGARVPILGICLGHQVIAQAHGGRIVRAREPLHGQASPVRHRGAGLLRGLPRTFEAARYHSLVVDAARLGRDLVATCHSDEGEVMGLRHRRHPVEGIQFHPESYMTPLGPRILSAFLRRTGMRCARNPHVVR